MIFINLIFRYKKTKYERKIYRSLLLMNIDLKILNKILLTEYRNVFVICDVHIRMC